MQHGEQAWGKDAGESWFFHSKKKKNQNKHTQKKPQKTKQKLSSLLQAHTKVKIDTLEGLFPRKGGQ